MPPVFAWLMEQGGVSRHEMLKTLNCGIGMILVISKENVDYVCNGLQAGGEAAFVLGEITANQPEKIEYF